MTKQLIVVLFAACAALVARGNASWECRWSCDFESIAAGTCIADSEKMDDRYLSDAREDDASCVVSHDSGEGKYLEIDTNGGTDWFSVLALRGGKLDGYFEPSAGSSLYVDAMMIFTPIEDLPSLSDFPDMPVGELTTNARPLWTSGGMVGVGGLIRLVPCGTAMFVDDKIALYRCIESVATNWCVLAGMDGDGGDGAFALVAANPSESLPDSSKAEWVRVTVRALNDGSEAGLGFEIYINGIKVAANGKSVFVPWPPTRRKRLWNSLFLLTWMPEIMSTSTSSC